MDGWMDGWMDGCQCRYVQCLCRSVRLRHGWSSRFSQQRRPQVGFLVQKFRLQWHAGRNVFCRGGMALLVLMLLAGTTLSSRRLPRSQRWTKSIASRPPKQSHHRQLQSTAAGSTETCQGVYSTLLNHDAWQRAVPPISN